MALFYECMLQCARKALDTADIVRDGGLTLARNQQRRAMITCEELPSENKVGGRPVPVVISERSVSFAEEEPICLRDRRANGITCPSN